MVRFIHTADAQLGMPFRWAAGDAGARLRELRLECIDRIARVAEEREADFVLVAGDLFDSNTVENRVVIQACERFRAFRVPVLVIPGNHDHCAGPDCVFRRRAFLDNRPQNLTVLETREPHPLPGLDTVILPAPLQQRHEVGDTTGHFDERLGADLVPGGHRIGLAHGSVLRFDDGDGDAINQIDADRAVAAGLDYLALGDWHGMRQINGRAWYSGSPEPTAIDAGRSGHVLVVEVAAPGAAPVVTPVRIARSRWVRHEQRLTDPRDVDRLARWCEELPDPLDTVARLELSGTLPLGDIERLDRCIERMTGRLLHLRVKGPGVLARPTDDEIDEIGTDGYVRLTVDRLRAMATTGEDGAPAADALQLLFQLSVREDASA